MTEVKCKCFFFFCPQSKSLWCISSNGVQWFDTSSSPKSRPYKTEWITVERESWENAACSELILRHPWNESEQKKANLSAWLQLKKCTWLTCLIRPRARSGPERNHMSLLWTGKDVRWGLQSRVLEFSSSALGQMIGTRFLAPVTSTWSWTAQ